MKATKLICALSLLLISLSLNAQTPPKENSPKLEYSCAEDEKELHLYVIDNKQFVVKAKEKSHNTITVEMKCDQNNIQKVQQTGDTTSIEWRKILKQFPELKGRLQHIVIITTNIQ